MAAAAASSARRRRNSKLMELERNHLSYKRRLLKDRAAEIFDVMSADGEWLAQSSEIKKLLARSLLIIEPAKLQEDAVQLVMNTARHSQQRDGMSPPPGMEDGALCKEALVDAVEKYGEYIRKAKKIDIIFQKYDKGKDGYLSKKELRSMLEDYERKAGRSRNGLVVNLYISDEDLDWIMEQSDADGNNKISHAEYLPAIAAWEELAEMKLAETATCGCVIL
ncbi:expressed unknown protein [Seminavis robusta]|uniref:EF-hand domain-containing protein n=1 Tax=Seminavis robusta TaxID=568900 RepID=A0A9N8DF72_9STRA|nr:expressed unknown protein [Seminavis robusta]|eukprot:Sro112_g055600.1 n/a (222) ;mRNA; f:39978-40643